jgi:hypothetical protein
MTAVLESIGILQVMNIGKYLPRRNIFVRIEEIPHNYTHKHSKVTYFFILDYNMNQI